MCRRALIACYLIVAAISPVRSMAQSPDALRSRLDQELARVSRAKAAHDAYVQAYEKRRALPDTQVIAGGNIRIATEPRIAGIVGAAAARADSNLRELGSVLPVLAGSFITIRYDTGGRYTEPYASLTFTMPRQVAPRQAGASVDADAIAASIEEMTISRLFERMPSPFSTWRVSTTLPLRAADRNRETVWSAVRLDVLRSRSLLGPRCYNGEIAACAMLLGLATTDDPVMAWYDSLARIDAVRTYRARVGRFNRPDADKCLRGDDAACGRALHTIDVLVRPPASGISREAIVLEAIRMGGEGALQRILVGGGSPSEALAAAAGVPVDSVLKMWQLKVRQGSIGSDDFSPRIALVAVGWIALLLGLSTRISRWR